MRIKRTLCAIGAAVLGLAARPAMAGDSTAVIPCSDINTIYAQNPALGAQIYGPLVDQAMHYFDDQHVLGEQVHVDFSRMTPLQEIDFFRAWCRANPDEKIATGMRALYRHMADLTASGGAGPVPPPPAAVAPPTGLPPAAREGASAAIAHANSEPLADLVKDVGHAHPAAMMVLAKRLFDDGRLDDADFWYYEGKLRWLAYLRSDPALQGPFGEADKFQVFDADVSPDIDWCAGKDLPHHLTIQQAVLDWDASHPDPFTPADSPAKVHARDGLKQLMANERANAAAIRKAHDDRVRSCPLDAGTVAGDPYSGSGGAMFGTPPDLVPAYDAAKFAAFRIGVTTKADVVQALGRPEMWFTDTDGSSTLSYPYKLSDAGTAILGMTRRVSASFTFDAKRVLTKITLPGDKAP